MCPPDAPVPAIGSVQAARLVSGPFPASPSPVRSYLTNQLALSRTFRSKPLDNWDIEAQNLPVRLDITPENHEHSVGQEKPATLTPASL